MVETHGHGCRPPLSWTLVFYALVVELVTSILFEVIYVGANYITSLHDLRFRVGLPFESHIPLFPSWVIAYWSLWPLFLLAVFILRTKNEIHSLAKLVLLETAVASVFFVLIPAEANFGPGNTVVAAAGAWETMYRLTVEAVLRYNLFPSLHVAFAVTCALTYGKYVRPALKTLFFLWAFLIAASTVLLHLHHLVDVLGGVFLALSCHGFLLSTKRRKIRSALTLHPSGASIDA